MRQKTCPLGASDRKTSPRWRRCWGSGLWTDLDEVDLGLIDRERLRRYARRFSPAVRQKAEAGGRKRRFQNPP